MHLNVLATAVHLPMEVTNHIVRLALAPKASVTLKLLLLTLMLVSETVTAWAAAVACRR
jgi:hypothetical protein